MPLLNKIEGHIENTKKLSDDIKKDIEKLFDKLNAKNFISSPGPTIDVLIFAITQRILKKYIKPITKESKRYVKSVLSTKGEQEL